MFYFGYLPQQFHKVLRGEFVRHVRSFEQRVRQRLFGLVQTQNLLLNGMLSDEVIDRYFLVLSDTISAVGRLLLNSGIPSRGQINHIVCIRKV